jgi:hypothetical protein
MQDSFRGDAGFWRRNRMLVTMVFWIIYLYIFWRVGDPFPLATRTKGKHHRIRICASVPKMLIGVS